MTNTTCPIPGHPPDALTFSTDSQEHTSGRLIEVHIDALQLKVRVALVCTGRVDAMLVAYNLPELCANLVTALATLDVHNLTHLVEDSGGG